MIEPLLLLAFYPSKKQFKVLATQGRTRRDNFKSIFYMPKLSQVYFASASSFKSFFNLFMSASVAGTSLVVPGGVVEMPPGQIF